MWSSTSGPMCDRWGVLVVPKDVAPGERRPVVVVHGATTCHATRSIARGRPTTISVRCWPSADSSCSRRTTSTAARIAIAGSIARPTPYAPRSFIHPGQHERILEWLGSLPFVDAERIAFYGLSYGGETAVRSRRSSRSHALSICSGDFNQWTRKVAATDQPWSFMRTIEWEMPYWNWGLRSTTRKWPT